MVHISIFRKSNFFGDFIGLNILFWPLYADDPWSRGNLACVFVWQPCLHWKSVQIGVILYTFIALSKQESAPLKKTISDHGDRSKGRFSGATLHVRYPTFGTNGLSSQIWHRIQYMGYQFKKKLKIRISWRNLNQNLKYFNLLVSGPYRFKWWKKLEVENLVGLSL